jgi:hypothetical protein
MAEEAAAGDEIGHKALPKRGSQRNRESGAAAHICQLAAPGRGLYLRSVPLLPKSLQGRRASHEADPLHYLQGVLAFFLGGGAIVAVLLALTGLAPGALMLAGLLWTIFGVLSGLLDAVVGPMIDWGAGVLSNVGLVRAGGGFSAEESMVARGLVEAAAESYLRRSQEPRTRVAALVRRAQLLAGPLGQPGAAAAELEEVQRDAHLLAGEDDMRLGLALAELYEQKLADPGRAMVEVRRLIDRYPHTRQARELRGLLGALRSQHFADSAP